ncbi:4645_t:CDS:2, partial [Racocetra persica]
LYFVKTISGSKKYVHGNAAYRTNNNEEEFRELTYKRFIASQKSLITELEKNFIVLIVGRYILEDTEYLTLIQTIPISISDKIKLTSDNLSHGPLLLFYSAPVVSNSYFLDNEHGIESLLLSRKLYNGVNSHKNVESQLPTSNRIILAMNPLLKAQTKENAVAQIKNTKPIVQDNTNDTDTLPQDNINNDNTLLQDNSNSTIQPTLIE